MFIEIPNFEKEIEELKAFIKEQYKFIDEQNRFIAEQNAVFHRIRDEMPDLIVKAYKNQDTEAIQDWLTHL